MKYISRTKINLMGLCLLVTSQAQAIDKRVTFDQVFRPGARLNVISDVKLEKRDGLGVLSKAELADVACQGRTSFLSYDMCRLYLPVDTAMSQIDKGAQLIVDAYSYNANPAIGQANISMHIENSNQTVGLLCLTDGKSRRFIDRNGNPALSLFVSALGSTIEVEGINDYTSLYVQTRRDVMLQCQQTAQREKSSFIRATQPKNREINWFDVFNARPASL